MGAPEAIAGPMQVTLMMDEGMHKQLRSSEGIVAVAEAFQIDSPETANDASLELRAIKERAKQIESMRDGFLAPAQQIIDNAKALFNPARNALARAETIIKGKLSDWTKLEQERVSRENRERQEAERRARAEAEAKAAAERARAEEQARKKAEEARIAEESRRKAEAEANAARESGNRAAAAEAERRAQAAAAERARREEEERAAREEGERKAIEAQLAAAAKQQSVAAPAAVAMTAGFGMRDNWIAELAPNTTEDQAKEAIVKAIGTGRTDLLALLKLDLPAAKKLAKALREQFNVPGLVARNDKVAVSR